MSHTDLEIVIQERIFRSFYRTFNPDFTRLFERGNLRWILKPEIKAWLEEAGISININTRWQEDERYYVLQFETFPHLLAFKLNFEL
jgi:hypothetical protein